MRVRSSALARVLRRLANRLAPDTRPDVVATDPTIATLPRQHAAAIRHVLNNLTYADDGLVTLHACDFMKEPRFRAAMSYAQERTGYLDLNMEWRVHTFLWALERSTSLPGDVVECGVDRAFMFNVAQSYFDLARLPKTIFLVDSFSGIKKDLMSDEEIRINNPDRYHYHDTHEMVRSSFANCPNVKIIKGNVPAVLENVPASAVAFIHIDMNNVVPEVAAAEFFWDRLTPGGMMLLDDYAYAEVYRFQREGFDAFAARHGTRVLTLASGQGLILKHPASSPAGASRA